MKKLNSAFALFVTVSLLFAVEAHAAKDTITVANFDYTPQNVTINLGDTVVFIWASGNHPTASDNSTWTTFPMNSTDTLFELVLGSAGQHFYHCTNHGSPQAGMFGSITVIDPAGVPDPSESVVTVAQDYANQSLIISTQHGNGVMLMTLDGRLMINKAKDTESTTLNVALLAKGLYLVGIHENGRIIATRKVMLQ